MTNSSESLNVAYQLIRNTVDLKSAQTTLQSTAIRGEGEERKKESEETVVRVESADAR